MNTTANASARKGRTRAGRHTVEVRDRRPQPSMWVPGGSRNGLTFTDIFCGAGGSSIGLANAGFELALAANHWDRAIETHSANFRDAEHLCADVNNYDMRRLPRTNVLWASPICFPAGTTVLTRRGPVPIEEVQVGDEVLTHAGRWRPVVKTMRNTSDTVIVKGHGHNELETTAEHPFFARRVGRVWNNAVRDYRKRLGQREWVEAKNLDSHMWATPRAFGEPMPVPVVGGRGVEFTESFWWMVGRWLGDGYVRINDDARRQPRHDIYICCGDHEADDLGAALAAIAPAAGPRCVAGELRWRRTHPATVTVYETSHAGLTCWLTEHFGRHAHGKRLPAWVLTMPDAWRRALLDGYISADGNTNPGNGGTTSMTRFSTVSRPLAVGLRLLAVSLGHSASMHAPGRRSVGSIQGRAVAMRPSWSVGWTNNPDPSHVQTVDDETHRWSKVRSVRDARRQVQVYNLSVAEDESYVADGIVVHNCTEMSPAGGTSGYRRPKGKRDGQLDMLEELGHVPKDGKDRTRATFHDVIRAAEVHRYEMVFVENVPDVVDRWQLFDWWVDGMRRLGYLVQFLSVSSAHVGGDGILWAPQWRDRLYMVFTRKDIGRQPDVTVRPWSLCTTCGEVVQGVQTWCRSVQGRQYKVGRYRRNPNSSYGQYWYTCPNRRCQAARVEPFVLPAVAAIDWSDLGTRIGDMPRYPKSTTIARIEAGLQMPVAAPLYANSLGGPLGSVMDHPGLVWPGSFMVNSNHDDTRVYPVDGQPLAARTTKIGDAVVCPPMTMPVGGTWAEEPVNVLTGPMRTQLANEKGCEALVTPEAFLAVLRNHATATSLGEPMPTLAAQGNHFALVVPYYTTRTKARTTDEPLPTVPTHDRFALVAPAVAVDDCRMRMLKPRESLAAQAFPGDYTVHGNLGEQTMQAGNAVSTNVAQLLAERAAPILCN